LEDVFGFGEMELSANLPFFREYNFGRLEAHGAFKGSQVLEIERFDENHHPVSVIRLRVFP
jgi:hypothetical protein